MAAISGRRTSADSGSRPHSRNGHRHAGIRRRSRDPPTSVRHRRGRPDRVAGERALSIEKAQRELGYTPRPGRAGACGRPLRYLLGHTCRQIRARPDQSSLASARCSRIRRFRRAASLMQSRNIVRNMLHDHRANFWPSSGVAGPPPGPPQLLALIWIAWLISWVVASFWSGRTAEAGDDLGLRGPTASLFSSAPCF